MRERRQSTTASVEKILEMRERWQSATASVEKISLLAHAPGSSGAGRSSSWPRQSMNLGSPAARTKWRLPTALLLKGLIRPVNALGKPYVITHGMRGQYQTIAASNMLRPNLSKR